MVLGYQYKWVCSECGGIHWYDARRCSSCKGKGTLLKESTRKMNDKLRLEIDELQLEKELMLHPKMFHHWTRKAADAQLRFDEAKSDFDVVKSELNLEIRKDPSEYGISKLTEAALAAVIVLQPEYKASAKRVNETKHELQICQAAVQALESKRRSLGYLVELWIRDYYSDPKITMSTKEGEEFVKGQVRTRGRRRSREDNDE